MPVWRFEGFLALQKCFHPWDTMKNKIHTDIVCLLLHVYSHLFEEEQFITFILFWFIYMFITCFALCKIFLLINGFRIKNICHSWCLQKLSQKPTIYQLILLVRQRLPFFNYHCSDKSECVCGQVINNNKNENVLINQ